MGKSLKQRVLAISLASSMLAEIVGSTATLLTKNYLYDKKSEKRVENEIGYDDINPLFSYKINAKDFVILNVGDHNKRGVDFQDSKMKLCNKQDISLGVIIDSHAESESEIYDDAQYAKSLVRDYKIDFPVYLNIDNIIENSDLEPLMKEKLIKDFLEKGAANNIYVGIAGSDENLHIIEEYCDLSNYDAYLIDDNGDIKYGGTCNVVKDENGKITAKNNLAETITKKGLNDSDGFAEDGIYEIKEGSYDPISLSFSSNMSIKEICDYNDISEKDLIPGTVLRIPTQTNVTSSGKQKKVSLDEPIVGADISYAQGNDHDWNALKDNFDYVILKCNQGTETDSCFEKNASGCNINNIPMGVYTYNNYDVTNCNDMEDFKSNQGKQVQCTLENLKNKKVEFPVYLDIEASDGGSLSDLLSSKHVKVMLDIWKKNITAVGYTPGIYCNYSGYQYLSSCVDYNLSDDFELWVAGGDQYTGSKEDIDFDDVVPSSILNDDNIDMAQSTDSAIGAGSGNSAGHLDINFSKVDYEYIPSGIDEIKEFSRISCGDVLIIAGSCLMLEAGIAVGCCAIGHAKNKKRLRSGR